MHPEPGSKRHTRVVWDLENVRVPANQTFQLVLSLERWLTAQQLWGSNVDGLITCFYNPQTMPKTVSEALDRDAARLSLGDATRMADAALARPAGPAQRRADVL